MYCFLRINDPFQYNIIQNLILKSTKIVLIKIPNYRKVNILYKVPLDV